MNIDQLQPMLELNAVQNLSTNNSASSNQSATFQNILSEILIEAEMDSLAQPINSSQPLQTLDSTSTAANNPLTALTSAAMPPLSLLKNTGNFEQIINQASQLYNVPAKLITAVIQQESSFNPNAVSQSGAEGLMQLMPATARSLGVNDAFDPEQNIMAGTKYLKQMLDKYSGNIDLGLAAYNAGANNVDKYNGIPPFTETENYVKNITSMYDS